MTKPRRRRKGAIRLGLIAVAGCGAALVAGAALLSAPAVAVVAGGQYDDLAPWVPGFTALGALFAIAQLLVYAQLASGDRPTTAVVWIVLAAYIAFVEITASTLPGVLFPALTAAAVVAIWGLAREQVSRPRRVAPTVL